MSLQAVLNPLFSRTFTMPSFERRSSLEPPASPVLHPHKNSAPGTSQRPAFHLITTGIILPTNLTYRPYQPTSSPLPHLPHSSHTDLTPPHVVFRTDLHTTHSFNQPNPSEPHGLYFQPLTTPAEPPSHPSHVQCIYSPPYCTMYDPVLQLMTRPQSLFLQQGPKASANVHVSQYAGVHCI
ncbi:predicted protein [Plenodomus lingam JN3]|uniref:Predicted protein n=1 Tax=Leptosphaeria maculans (strain JN3 / isolate v23.1.3 / race Av1-4-5-6-7-8) TaxID=985895 RepID=E5A1Z3_LEPMJ|nr:predicted protein [Plenodomus lingam JN3]CBX97710.1 predicted protein [Plenodomus lingam JN3]